MGKGTSVPKKAKNMMYTQQVQHLPVNDFDTLVDEIKVKLKPKKFAAIVHDKDVDDHGNPEASHVHVMMNFDNARSINSIAKILNDKPQYLEVWEGNSGNGYAYLIHATENAKGKYQYKPTEVRANFDYLAELQKIKTEIRKSKGDAETKVLLDALYEGLITRSELEQKLSGSQYGKLKPQIDNIWTKALQKKAELWRKDMIENNRTVTSIWIYGGAGTGKTSLAKDYARKMNRDFFVSGSSRDIFQNYEGQHTIILDELRPRHIQYSDLLRLIDPYGVDSQVMAPARYSDKAIAADLVIITTPFTPVVFYREMRKARNFFNEISSDADSLDQLLRRISLTIEMTEDFIYMAEYDITSEQGFKADPATRQDNPYSKKARPCSVANSFGIYSALFTAPQEESHEDGDNAEDDGDSDSGVIESDS